MIGVKIQKTYAVLMVIVDYLIINNEDDIKYLKENKLSVKHEKGVKDLIANRRKLIRAIETEIKQYNKFVVRAIVKNKTKIKKDFVKALKTGEVFQSIKNEETPYIDLDKLVGFIFYELENVNQYKYLVDKITTNPYMREGVNEQRVQKTVKMFIKRVFG